MCDQCGAGPGVALIHTNGGTIDVCRKCLDEMIEYEKTRYRYVPGTVTIPKGNLRYVEEKSAHT